MRRLRTLAVVGLLALLLLLPGSLLGGTSARPAPSPVRATHPLAPGSGSSAPAGELRSTYPVTFLEYGLPAGTNWTVDLNGTSASSAAGITFSMPNGSYSFSVSTIAGYSDDPASGNLLVAGAAVEQPVHFVAAVVGNTLSLYNNTLLPGNASAQSGIQPLALTVDSAQDELFVDDYSTSNVAIANLTTGLVTGYIPLSGSPCGIALDNLTGMLYVSIVTRGTVAVVDPATDAVTSYLRVGLSPCSIAYDPVNQFVYVADTGSNQISVINATSDLLQTSIAFNSSKAVSVDPASGNIYAIASTPATLAVISPSTEKVTLSVGAPASPSALVFDPHAHEVFVASSSLGLVRAYSVTVLQPVANISVGSDPFALSYDPQNFAVYCANYGSNNVSRILLSTVSATIPAGANPDGAAVDSATGMIYIANRGTANVTEIGSATNRSSGDIVTGLAPEASALDAADGNLVIADAATGSLTLVNATSWKVVGSVPVGSDPDAVLYSGGSKQVVVANAGSDNLTILNARTLALVKSLPVGADPSSIAYDAPAAMVYVTNTLSGNVSKVNLTCDCMSPSMTTGGAPYPAFFDAVNGDLYVGGVVPSELTVYGSSGGPLANISVGAEPSAIATDPSTGYLYVANFASNSVTVVNASSQSDVTSLAVSAGPDALAFDPATDGVYVADLSSNSLSVISSRGLTLQGTLALNNNAPTSVTLLAGGSTLAVTDELSGAVSFVQGIPLPEVFPESFTESGLPAGTSWSVAVEGTSVSAATPTITFTLQNGTYYYDIGSVAGFTALPTAGDLSVHGSAQKISVAYSKVILRYQVTFKESGLPTGTNWSVDLNGTASSSTSASVSFSVPSGNYSYAVQSALGYGPSPRSGTVTVQKSTLAVAVVYTLPKYNVSFVAQGKPDGVSWSVTFDGTSVSLNTSQIAFTGTRALVNGSYPFVISRVAGFHVTPSSGTLNVNGSSLVENITFSPALFSVTFYQSGLTARMNWSVTLNGLTEHGGAFSGIAFTLPNGTFDYTVASESGYTRLPSGGMVSVNGASQVLHIAFLKPSTFGFAALLVSPIFYGAIIAGVLIVGVFAYYALRRKRPSSGTDSEEESEAGSDEEAPPEPEPAPEEAEPAEPAALPEPKQDEP